MASQLNQRPNLSDLQISQPCTTSWTFLNSSKLAAETRRHNASLKVLRKRSRNWSNRRVYLPSFNTFRRLKRMWLCSNTRREEKDVCNWTNPSVWLSNQWRLRQVAESFFLLFFHCAYCCHFCRVVLLCFFKFRSQVSIQFFQRLIKIDRHDSAYQCQHDNQQNSSRWSVQNWQINAFWFVFRTIFNFDLHWPPIFSWSHQWVQPRLKPKPEFHWGECVKQWTSFGWSLVPHQKVLELCSSHFSISA